MESNCDQVVLGLSSCLVSLVQGSQFMMVIHPCNVQLLWPLYSPPNTTETIPWKVYGSLVGRKGVICGMQWKLMSSQLDQITTLKPRFELPNQSTQTNLWQHNNMPFTSSSDHFFSKSQIFMGRHSWKSQDLSWRPYVPLLVHGN